MVCKSRYALRIIVMLLWVTPSIFSQTPSWHVGMLGFFDNTEFSGSYLKVPQTMSGIQFAPEAGLTWDSVHIIRAGVNLMHEFGSNKAIDKFYPTAYYYLDMHPVRFVMGAYPRSITVDRYPRLFFQDSISYYRPNINGISLEIGNENRYINLWLDWTGRMTEDVRETFFVGLSGKYTYKIFYVRHLNYMFHFFRTSDPFMDEALHDNLLFLTSAGVDLSGKIFLDRFDINIGWVAGMERARAEQTGWMLMSGILSEARAEYKFFGLFNSFYKGERLLNFYGDHSTELYWSDPVYRAGTYNRSDFYLRFFNTEKINIEVTYSLHFLESRVYHEQLLKVRVNLDRP